LNTSDFDYDLPTKFIAQTPLEPRDSSRLLVISRKTGWVQEHAAFRDLSKFLHPGDLLVLNQTRVIPARLFARKIPTGGRVEILLLRKTKPRTWECLVGGKGLVVGKQVQVENGPVAEIIKILSGARRLVGFSEPLETVLNDIGRMPLPPYIHEVLKKPERYQTVYSKEPGSAAAPTAGLHFTQDLLDQLQAQGVNLTSVTLHVGLDTFAPVMEDDPLEHEIHTEWCQVTSNALDIIKKTKKDGGRIIAVGTTSVRTLETLGSRMIDQDAGFVEFSGPTNLFILPGYKFKIVDAMITNFHLPRSTLIMLVSAFVGRENILAAYDIAKQENYRFYSFGDAMLII
jgi:S-adenosylmethionine:tRNA ribosyltransferase-isomerase